jgi:hypothetical protein
MGFGADRESSTRREEPFTSATLSVKSRSSFTSSLMGAVTSIGVAAVSTGVSGGDSSFDRDASLFFSSVLRNTLIVVRSDLFGLQSAAATGVCSQTGQDEGRVEWPIS